MSDFDTRLRTKLERLDAAIPAPVIPSRAALDELAANAPLRARRGWRRARVALLLAAAAILALASAATAGRILFPDEPQPAIEAAIGDVFGGGDCLSAAGARVALRARLDALGDAGWEIRSLAGADQARCVGAAVDSSTHTVLLIAAAGRDVLTTMDAVRAELMSRCLGRSDAIELVRSAFVSLGIRDFSVRADPDGPQMAPVDQIDAYRAHVAAGCYVYSGIQNGRDVDLWGP